jgi:hypothetical protein
MIGFWASIKPEISAVFILIFERRELQPFPAQIKFRIAIYIAHLGIVAWWDSFS